MEISDIIASAKRYPFAWGSAFLSIALGLYLYFTMGSLRAYEDEVFELEKEVQTLKTNSHQGADIEEDFQRFSELFDKVDSVLMDHTQIANNTGYFYNFARSHPVEISDVSQRPVIGESASPPQGDLWSKKHFSIIPFSMEVNGLLNDIVEMFYHLDTSSQLIEVRKFEIETTSQPEVGYMIMHLEVNVMGKTLKTVEEGGNS